MSNSSMTKRAIAIAAAIIVAFTGGYLLGATGNIGLNISVNHNGTAAVQQAAAPAAAAPAAAPAAAAPAAAPAAETPAAETTAAPAAAAPAAETPKAEKPAAEAATKAAKETKPADKAPTTKDEIVNYFVTSANKIKTSAKSVTRNYEDLQHNEDKLVVPGILQGIGKSLISTFLKKDETPVTWEGADIVANYPVQGTDKVSTAKPSDVKEATCKDDGKYYNITLKFIDGTDPVDSGVATSFNIIRGEDVKSAAKVVSDFSSDYYDAVITCKVDKATGNMVSANYKLPIVMHVKAMGVDAQVGMTFNHDYTIAY